ncbi:MAG TPA: flagellar hook-length control protein FliK [Thermodesulfatator sp.]|nr:flagellar hook-length control protein FliK [Thermodesulfatator sp.]
MQIFSFDPQSLDLARGQTPRRLLLQLGETIVATVIGREDEGLIISVKGKLLRAQVENENFPPGTRLRLEVIDDGVPVRLKLLETLAPEGRKDPLLLALKGLKGSLAAGHKVLKGLPGAAERFSLAGDPQPLKILLVQALTKEPQGFSSGVLKALKSLFKVIPDPPSEGSPAPGALLKASDPPSSSPGKVLSPETTSLPKAPLKGNLDPVETGQRPPEIKATPQGEVSFSRPSFNKEPLLEASSSISSQINSQRVASKRAGLASGSPVETSRINPSEASWGPQKILKPPAKGEFLADPPASEQVNSLSDTPRESPPGRRPLGKAGAPVSLSSSSKKGVEKPELTLPQTSSGPEAPSSLRADSKRSSSRLEALQDLLLQTASSLQRLQYLLASSTGLEMFFIPLWFRDGSQGYLATFAEEEGERPVRYLLFNLHLSGLGELGIEVRLEAEVFDLEIRVAHSSVKSAVESALPELLDRLTLLGYRPRGVRVLVAATDPLVSRWREGPKAVVDLFA